MNNIKLQCYIPSLDMTVKVQRLNFDTKTVEVLIGEDDYLHNDLCEYDFKYVEFKVVLE